MYRQTLVLAAVLSSATFSTVTVAFSVPAAAATKPAAKKPAALAVAPADEYFGPLAMSILGIRNALKDSAAKLDADATADCDSTAKHVELIEVSVHAWETKYPKDSWLPRTVLALEHVYARIHTEEGRRRASQTATWLSQRYAKSKEAVALHNELAQAAAAPAPAQAAAAPAAAAPVTAAAPAAAPVAAAPAVAPAAPATSTASTTSH